MTDNRKNASPDNEAVKKNNSLFAFSESIMNYSLDKIIALIPLIAWGIYYFGPKAAIVLLLSSISFVLFDFVFGLVFTRKPFIIGNDSLFYGLLIGLAMPTSVPYYVILLVSFCSALGKCLFDKISFVRINPYSFSILLAYLVFGSKMISEGESELSVLLTGNLPSTSLWDMLFGVRGGTIGEVSAFLILLSFIWLILRKDISAATPCSAIVVVAAFAYFLPNLVFATDIIILKYAAYHILCGDLLFTIVFMLSDPKYGSTTSKGKIVIGAIAGLVIMIVRKFLGTTIPTAMIAVLTVNIITPAVDAIFRKSEVFGGIVKEK